ncbi:hypothetical protein NITHO_1920005 [Nitrolancea hollandica Lb]|uniref:RanBP2-type domain-containing protein n=1 Tax=Nitrolancea hollandica Lb TaxID=1129897 RepID=I4EEN2_9BACT|nr:hypothetical protein NITHO_1920005 [Nitrolancea hollandica Lb]
MNWWSTSRDALRFSAFVSFSQSKRTVSMSTDYRCVVCGGEVAEGSVFCDPCGVEDYEDYKRAFYTELTCCKCNRTVLAHNDDAGVTEGICLKCRENWNDEGIGVDDWTCNNCGTTNPDWVLICWQCRYPSI